tara:strand:- start:89 stop:565 length:477 start_codon:yes stop_codon:yes gene_type:complete
MENSRLPLLLVLSLTCTVCLASIIRVENKADSEANTNTVYVYEYPVGSSFPTDPPLSTLPSIGSVATNKCTIDNDNKIMYFFGYDYKEADYFFYGLSLTTGAIVSKTTVPTTSAGDIPAYGKLNYNKNSGKLLFTALDQDVSTWSQYSIEVIFLRISI